MISVLLLPLFINVASAPVVMPQDDPPIRLWINNDRRFLPGDRAKVEVRTRHDGYLLVFHVDPEGHLRVLFPLDPDQDNFVRGGKKYEVRGRAGRESFEVDNTTGTGTVYAAVSRDAFRFDGFVVGDHWDYRALAPSRLPDDPEQDLNEVVRRMAQGDFDYDLLNYYVTDRVAYQSDYSPYYGSSYYGGCFSCSPYYGSAFSIGIVFGRPYRSYYYDPYFYAYGPFYNPFFYDPYYYAAAYRPWYVYPYSYGYNGYYHNSYYPYYYGQYHTYGQRYTPYRFRGADGYTAGYRDRRRPTRFVNTVYNSPISRFRQPAVATPGRRLTAPVAHTPRGVGGRPEMISAPRTERRPVEARRSPSSDARENNGRASDARQKEPRLVRREVTSEPRERKEEPKGQRAPVERRDEPRPDRIREERRNVERPPAREARPARESAPRPESRPAPRQIERSSPPHQSGGGAASQPSNGDRRRH
jgi:Domain of unknown function (DUF4384)